MGTCAASSTPRSKNSGKSTVLVARTLNILLQGVATPDQILLCTFTEKAALELRDRLYVAARDLHLAGPLSDLKVGTIHGIANDFLMRYRQPHFSSIWQGPPQWPYVRQDLLGALSFNLRSRMAPKKTFSFTSDLKVFETCPRQYEFFRHYGYIPARSAERFFGALVHQTIEDIHRCVLAGKGSDLDEVTIKGFFALNFKHLVNLDLRPIGPKQRDEAFRQIMSYFKQNRDDMNRVIETEVDVSVEKDKYILTGKIDLLLGSDNKLELLDFKSQAKPQDDDARLDGYYKQLCIYAHILEERYGKTPDRLLLYWTGEHSKDDALMTFEYKPDVVTAAGQHFDKVVADILSGDFSITKSPEKRVCKECVLRRYCRL